VRGQLTNTPGLPGCHQGHSRPVPTAASRKRESPPTYKKQSSETGLKGAVPKSSALKRTPGAPQVPVRTSSAVKPQSQSNTSRADSNAHGRSDSSRTKSDPSTRNKVEQLARTRSDMKGEKVTKRVVRKKEERREATLKHRSSTLSSDD